MSCSEVCNETVPGAGQRDPSAPTLHAARLPRDCWVVDEWADEEAPPASDALQCLFERIWPYVPELRGFLMRRVPDGEIEDLVQDILLRLCRRVQGEHVEHPRSYLYQVANAAIVDRHRREASRCSRFHCELSDAAHPLDELSPLRILLAREDVSATEAALGALPERTREIIIAMRLEGGSLKSLALRYAISTSAIEKHVTRAMKALSRQRADDWSWPAAAPLPVRLDCYI